MNDTNTPRTRHVLISGASTGIGRVCAEYLASQGWYVYAGVRKAADAEALAAAHPGITPLMLDVTEAESIRAAIEALPGGGLDGLINNAGVAVAGPAELISLDDWRWQLEVNLTGAVALTQAALPLLRAVQGRLLFMGSIGGRSALPFYGPYNASKFALEALADTLRVELRPQGVHVAIIEPGAIRTPIWDKSLHETDARTASYPAAGRALYGDRMQAARDRSARAGAAGAAPEAVAAACLHALTSARPRARYRVGRDTSVRLLLESLPWRWRDALLERLMLR